MKLDVGSEPRQLLGMDRLIKMRRDSLVIMTEGLWHSSVDSYEPALH